MKCFVQKNLVDPSKFQIEFRTSPDANTICEAPKDSSGAYITDSEIIIIQDMYIDPADQLEKVVDPLNPPSVSTYKKASVDATLQSNKDTALLQQKRDNKLQKLRELRDIEFKYYETIVRHLVLGRRSDSAVIDAYYQSLLDVTNSYKDANGKGTAALDAFLDDMSDFSFPARV